MAEVKRYTASIMHPGVREDPEGLLVAYHHYAELKAKLERLTQAGNNLVYVASEHPVAETFVQAWWKEISHD